MPKEEMELDTKVTLGKQTCEEPLYVQLSTEANINTCQMSFTSTTTETNSNCPSFQLHEPGAQLTLKDSPEMPEVFTSLGSTLHHSNACTPCKFYRSKRGCLDGAKCKLCHFPHEDLTFSQIRRKAKHHGLAKRG